ncbi:MAG: hypothetical protein H7A37_06265 [Chlamydiales bacterium]|nr:hypothetical protein [Chlamydiia bacterium]MCP5507886.1 hypothetical protein [Chlamydiales bacterium]
MKKIILTCLFCLLFTSIYSIPTKETLEKKIFAVHATNTFPATRKLHAGFDTSASKTSHIAAFFSSTRPTLHFSLGELVRPVGDYLSWEDCTYAIITPLGDLLPQMVNINCYDSFILGDFDFTSSTIIVAPVGTKPDNLVQMFWYDPQSTTLREAIDNAIDQMDGWHIRMVHSEDESVLNEALCNGENINTKDFFSSLLQAYPYLSVGLRFDELDGNHYLLSAIEAETLILANYFFQIFPDTEEEDDFSIEYLLVAKSRLIDNFTSWKGQFRVYSLPNNSRQAIDRLEKVVLFLCSTIDNEVDMLEKHGTSIRPIKAAEIPAA